MNICETEEGFDVESSGDSEYSGSGEGSAQGPDEGGKVNRSVSLQIFWQ